MLAARPLRALTRRGVCVRRCNTQCAAVSAVERSQRLASNQLRTAATLLASLAPAVRHDPNLPSRVKEAAGERRFNSSSRRLYRELLFTAVRHWAWLEQLLGTNSEAAAACAAWLADETPEVRRLRESGALHSAGLPATPPASLEERRRALQALCGGQLCAPSELVAPAWLQTSAPLPPADLALSRTPLYIRLRQTNIEQRAPTSGAIAAELRALGAQLHATVLPCAWEVRPAELGAVVDVTAAPSFLSGLFEVQDLGSQLLLAAVAPPAGGHWLDACAGAGGKTLQLASLLGDAGRVHAEDVRASALTQLQLRAARAGLTGRVTTARTGNTASHAAYDGVLVDAPCTGSGTWRRSPHLRWQLTPDAVQAAAATQLRILHSNAARVRPGGLLVYATCSLARAENEAVIDSFLQASPRFEPAELPGAAPLGLPVRGGRLVVAQEAHNTDAFFVAAMRRTTS